MIDLSKQVGKVMVLSFSQFMEQKTIPSDLKLSKGYPVFFAVNSAGETQFMVPNKLGRYASLPVPGDMKACSCRVTGPIPGTNGLGFFCVVLNGGSY